MAFWNGKDLTKDRPDHWFIASLKIINKISKLVAISKYIFYLKSNNYLGLSLTHYNDKSRSSLAKMRPKWGHSRTAMKDVVLFQTNQGYYSRPHFYGLFGDEPGFREMQGHLVWRWLEQNFHIWTKKIIIFRCNHLDRHLYFHVKKWID